MQVMKQQLELDMKQWTGSKLGKEYIKAVYCHPAYLTYIQSTSSKIQPYVVYKRPFRFKDKNSLENLPHKQFNHSRALKAMLTPDKTDF